MSCCIREATPADYDALAPLEEAVGDIHHTARPDIFKPAVFGKEDFVELLRDDCVNIFVYEKSKTDSAESEILGFCRMSFLTMGRNILYTAMWLSHI